MSEATGDSVGTIIKDWFVHDILWEVCLGIVLGLVVGYIIGISFPFYLVLFTVQLQDSFVRHNDLHVQHCTIHTY